MIELKTKQEEIKFNDLARHDFIRRLLADLNVDLTISRMIYDDDKEAMKYFKQYIEMIKGDIDHFYNQILKF